MNIKVYNLDEMFILDIDGWEFHLSYKELVDMQNQSHLALNDYFNKRVRAIYDQKIPVPKTRNNGSD